MTVRLVPSVLVQHPERREWGLGQVQSVIRNRITVNFENAGKLLINSDIVELRRIDQIGDG